MNAPCQNGQATPPMGFTWGSSLPAMTKGERALKPLKDNRQPAIAVRPRSPLCATRARPATAAASGVVLVSILDPRAGPYESVSRARASAAGAAGCAVLDVGIRYRFGTTSQPDDVATRTTGAPRAAPAATRVASRLLAAASLAPCAFRPLHGGTPQFHMDMPGFPERARPSLLDPSRRMPAYSPPVPWTHSGAEGPTCCNHSCSRRRRAESSRDGCN
jgi:hypothetical protein